MAVEIRELVIRGEIREPKIKEGANESVPLRISPEILEELAERVLSVIRHQSEP